MSISFQEYFYKIACLAGLILFLYYAGPILIPVTFAILIALIILPLCKWFENRKIRREISSFISILLVTLFIGLIVTLLWKQLGKLLGDLSLMQFRLEKLYDDSLHWVNSNFSSTEPIASEDIKDSSIDMAKESGKSIVSNSILFTTNFFMNALLTMVYVFLFLIYRGGVRKVILSLTSASNVQKVSEMIAGISKVGQSYISGMGLMLLILGTCNSGILFLFHIDNFLFLGCLAALMAIVPYIGTTVGAAIPVVYAYLTTGSISTAFGILISFWAVQLIESNFLTPKIVGGSLNLNAFASIVSLIAGGYLWGIPGMILFLPITAMFRVFCSYYPSLKPVSELLGQNISK
ncbi:MAG: AI-2E family transporter [Bacteroidia bacterium]